jgi:hypothetical protein
MAQQLYRRNFKYFLTVSMAGMKMRVVITNVLWAFRTIYESVGIGLPMLSNSNESGKPKMGPRRWNP